KTLTTDRECVDFYNAQAPKLPRTNRKFSYTTQSLKDTLTEALADETSFDSENYQVSISNADRSFRKLA
ncbi:hypothetical protein CSC82_11695, partial [Rhodobacteraceae bacterium 4F10]